MDDPSLPSSPQPEDSNRRRWLQLAAVGSALVVAVAVIEIGRRGGRPDGAQFTSTVTNNPAASPGVPQRWTPPRPMDADEPVTFDQIMSRIKDFESDPRAAQFAKEAMKEPALKDVVAKFKEPRKASAPGGAKEFFYAVTGRVEFRQLAAKFMGDPGAAPLLARLAAASGVNDPLHNLAMLVALGAGAGDAAARALSPATRTGAVNAGGAAGAGASNASAFGSARTQSPAGLGAAAPHLAGLPEAEGPGPEAAFSRAQSGPPAAEKTAGQSAVKLNTNLAQANSETMDKVLEAWLRQYGLDPQVYLASLGTGLWDLCFTRHELAKCDKACENQPTMVSTKKHDLCAKPITPKPGLPYWDACLQAGFSELDCILECHNQSPPCDWDPDAVDRLCTPTPPDTCAPQCVSAGACQNLPPGGAPAAATAPAGTTPATPAGAQGGTYTIKPGDNMTKIVMAVYHITDPNVAYRTALELYDYGKNRSASSYGGRNQYDPNLIYPGKVLTLPPLPTLKGMTIS